MPPKKKRASTKTLVLHYGTAKVAIEVFSRTTRVDLLAGVREALGIRADAPLRFRDAGGSVVILSSSFSSGTELHVATESGAPAPAPAPAPAAPAAPAAGPIVWSTAEGGDIMAKRFIAGNGDPSHQRGWWAMSNIVSANKYFTLKFALNQCCTYVGVVPATLASLPLESGRSIPVEQPGLAHLTEIARQLPRDVPIDVGISVLVERHKIVMINLADRRQLHTIVNLTMPCKLCIYAHKHGIKCELIEMDEQSALHAGMASG